MGSGAWTTMAYVNNMSTRGFDTSSTAALCDSVMSLDTNQVYTARTLHPTLNPWNVMRECRDSEEHPETIPVILALDVTGSMGETCQMCAAQLNEIMTSLYKNVKDVEFMVMGIGDLACDSAPIQASQFESDVRILDQMMNIYFEGGGGGNGYESYTAAWHFALNHTDLDCHKRGKKGIIITMGDEPLNPYLPGYGISKVLGDPKEDIDTNTLYKQVCEKFDVYHLAIDGPSSYHFYKKQIADTWGKLLGENFTVCRPEELPQIITAIVNQCTYTTTVNADGEISW